MAAMAVSNQQRIAASKRRHYFIAIAAIAICLVQMTAVARLPSRVGSQGMTEEAPNSFQVCNF